MIFKLFRNLLPALMMVGSFVVPFAALLLFYEFNAPRNVSLISSQWFSIS